MKEYCGVKWKRKYFLDHGEKAYEDMSSEEKECKRAKDIEYQREANKKCAKKKKMRASAREYNEAHKEEKREYRKKYYQTHKEELSCKAKETRKQCKLIGSGIC